VTCLRREKPFFAPGLVALSAVPSALLLRRVLFELWSIGGILNKPRHPEPVFYKMHFGKPEQTDEPKKSRFTSTLV